jgi:gliding motility-associated-like protein
MKKIISKLGLFLLLTSANIAFGQAPVADFTTTVTTVCEGTTLTFTDASIPGATPIIDWGWSFDGAIPIAGPGPQDYTFNTPGSIDVTLVIFDGTANDTQSMTITVNAMSNAGNNNAITFCSNAVPPDPAIDLSTLLGGGQDAGGTWLETSGTSSGAAFTAATGMFDGNGLSIGGIYTFDYTVTGTAPCPDETSTITVTIDNCATPLTALFTTTSTTVCEGTTLTFTDASVATGTTITTWGWTFDGGTPVLGQGPHDYTFNTAGSIDVVLGISDGTLNETFTQTIIVNSAANSGNDNATDFCGNATPANPALDLSTLLGGAQDNGGTWNETSAVMSGGFTAATGMFDGNGLTSGDVYTFAYTVTGTAPCGDATSTITVTISDCVTLLAGFEYDDNICVGSCINFTDTTTGNPVSWSWDFGTDALPITSVDQNAGPICFDTPGIYTIQLTVTDAAGASNSTTNSITVFDLPTITAYYDTLIDLGGEVELNSLTTNFGDILWTPDTYFIDCDTCAITYAQPQLNTDYFVTITDPNGCTAHDTVKVSVNFIEGLGVPEAFSPNGDGINDQLVVKGFGITKMKFTVYNRYGQLVFQTENQKHGWDGSFNGKPLNPGVFVWTLEYALLNNSTGLLKGNTTIIR